MTFCHGVYTEFSYIMSVATWLNIFNQARLIMKLDSFFVICFCSLLLLFIGFDRAAQNTKRIGMQVNN